MRKYKYQLLQPYTIKTPIKPKKLIETSHIRLTTKGFLHIDKGYAWDGPSGPSVDTETFMRGALVHDALYQLMRTGELALSWRDEADKLLKTICLEDGMSRFRAWWVYRCVRAFARKAARPEPRNGVKIA